MAYLVTNNVFDPLSFDELVKPLAMYKQTYDQMMNQYDLLGQSSGEWEGKLGKEDANSNAYKATEAYVNGLNQAADDLSRNGLNLNTRNAVRKLNRDFQSTIKPISEAWERRNQQRSLQQKFMLENPGSFIERDMFDAANGNIDNFVSDAGYNFGNTYSAKELQALAARKFSAIQKELRGKNQNGQDAFLSDEQAANLKPVLQKLLPYQYSYIENYGISSREYEDWINGKLEDSPAKEVLDAIADNVFNETGIGRWASDSEQQRARDMIRGEGINAVGTSQRHVIKDDYGMNAALESIRYPDGRGNKGSKDKNNGGENEEPKQVTPTYQTKEMSFDNIPMTKKAFRKKNGYGWDSTAVGNELLTVGAAMTPFLLRTKMKSDKARENYLNSWEETKTTTFNKVRDANAPVFDYDDTDSLKGNLYTLASKGVLNFIDTFDESTNDFTTGKHNLTINDLWKNGDFSKPKFNDFKIKVFASGENPVVFEFGNVGAVSAPTKSFTNQTKAAIQHVQKLNKRNRWLDQAEKVENLLNSDLSYDAKWGMVHDLFPDADNLDQVLSYVGSYDYNQAKNEYIEAVNNLQKQIGFELHGDRGDLSEAATKAYTPYED